MHLDSNLRLCSYSSALVALSGDSALTSSESNSAHKIQNRSFTVNAILRMRLYSTLNCVLRTYSSPPFAYFKRTLCVLPPTVLAYYVSTTGTLRKVFIDRNCKTSISYYFARGSAPQNKTFDKYGVSPPLIKKRLITSNKLSTQNEII